MSTMWSSSSCVSGETLALRAASSVAAATSAASSPRLIAVIDPSPMRVGIFGSPARSGLVGSSPLVVDSTPITSCDSEPPAAPASTVPASLQ